MDRMPDKPYQELLVATAGPAVNVIIALILLLARQAFGFDAALRIEDPTVSLTQRLAAETYSSRCLISYPPFLWMADGCCGPF